MKWEVRGADASSGDDRLMVIDGLSAEEVEAKARYAGMLVSSINPVAAAPVVAYAMPEQQKAAARDVQPPTPATPDYDDIRRGATWLRMLGALLILVGFIVVGVSAWTLVAFIREL